MSKPVGEVLVLDDVERLLAEAKTPEDLKRLVDGFSAVELMAKRIEARDTQVKAWAAKLRAEAAAAVYYSQLPDEGGRPEKNSLPEVTNKQQTEETLGVSRKTLAEWLNIARKMRNEPGRLEEFQALCLVHDTDPTAKDFLKNVHVSKNSVENEWYTPAYIIEKAREVMGRIDLDPASSEKANETVQATRFYDMDIDGLAQEWSGNVWLNPPYAKGIVNSFVDKLIEEFGEGDVPQAILLVNNGTETEWGDAIGRVLSAVCWHKGRISFTNVKEGGTPLQGQLLIYLGPNKERFSEVFSLLGPVHVGGVYGS